MKLSKFSSILILIIFCLLSNISNVQATVNDVNISSNENISFVIYGENFTYENAPDIIKKEYLNNCVALGISPKSEDEIFVPLSITENLNINTYSSLAYCSISYHDNYIQVKGSKNYSINVNTTYVGYNHITSGNAVHCLQLLLCEFNSKYHVFPDISIDSLFGPNTHDALIKFQDYTNLSTDAICGPNTWKTFFNYI